MAAAAAADLANFRQLARKIVCVGRNYRDHALELKNPIPKKPMLFLKGNNALVGDGESIRTPEGCKNLHQEVELAVVIGKKASKVRKDEAMDYVGGYTIALDMTARDWQDEFKAAGHPWFLSKSFDTSCPVGGFVERAAVADPHALELSCTINGEVRQRDRTSNMIFDIPTLLEFTTRCVTLDVGDLLLTGTPAGVGQCRPGDTIEIALTDLLKASFKVE